MLLGTTNRCGFTMRNFIILNLLQYPEGSIFEVTSKLFKPILATDFISDKSYACSSYKFQVVEELNCLQNAHILTLPSDSDYVCEPLVESDCATVGMTNLMPAILVYSTPNGVQCPAYSRMLPCRVDSCSMSAKKKAIKEQDEANEITFSDIRRMYLDTVDNQFTSGTLEGGLWDWYQDKEVLELYPMYGDFLVINLIDTLRLR